MRKITGQVCIGAALIMGTFAGTAQAQLQLNQPPEADVNGPTNVPLSTSAAGTFDGSQSRDPDGRIISYRWAGPGCAQSQGGSTTPLTSYRFDSCPLGSVDVTLTVTDNGFLGGLGLTPFLLARSDSETRSVCLSGLAASTGGVDGSIQVRRNSSGEFASLPFDLRIFTPGDTGTLFLTGGRFLNGQASADLFAQDTQGACSRYATQGSLGFTVDEPQAGVTMTFVDSRRNILSKSFRTPLG